MNISDNFRLLDPAEVQAFAAQHADAWKDPAIPLRQFELAALPEMAKFREGHPVAPFDALLRALKILPDPLNVETTTLLDVGASAGYYKEVLWLGGYRYDYTGVDFSPAFEKLARELFPDIQFKVGDARQLPYVDGSFDIVLSGGVITHTFEYEQVIAETARVARRYAIFSRTPLVFDKPTEYYSKTAYEIPVIEIHFDAIELMSLFRKHGFKVLALQAINPEEPRMTIGNFVLRKI